MAIRAGSVCWESFANGNGTLLGTRVSADPATGARQGSRSQSATQEGDTAGGQVCVFPGGAVALILGGKDATLYHPDGTVRATLVDVMGDGAAVDLLGLSATQFWVGFGFGLEVRAYNVSDGSIAYTRVVPDGGEQVSGGGAVDPAGVFYYVTTDLGTNDFRIRRYDLVADAPLADLRTFLSGDPIPFRMMALQDGTLLAVFDDTTLQQLSTVDGSMVQTYPLANLNCDLFRGADATTFWSVDPWVFDQSGPETYREWDVASAASVNTWTIPANTLAFNHPAFVAPVDVYDVNAIVDACSLAVRAEVPTSETAQTNPRGNYVDRFYVNGANDAIPKMTIQAIRAADGAVLGTWDLRPLWPLAGGVVHFTNDTPASPGNDIAYYALTGATGGGVTAADLRTVFRYDLVNSVPLAPLVVEGARQAQSILVLRNGEILVGWNGVDVDTNLVVHYAADGTLLHTYPLSVTATRDDAIFLAAAADDLSFWVGYRDPDNPNPDTYVTLAQIRITDGVVLHAHTITNTFKATVDAAFGIDWQPRQGFFITRTPCNCNAPQTPVGRAGKLWAIQGLTFAYQVLPGLKRDDPSDVGE